MLLARRVDRARQVCARVLRFVSGGAKRCLCGHDLSASVVMVEEQSTHTHRLAEQRSALCPRRGESTSTLKKHKSTRACRRKIISNKRRAALCAIQSVATKELLLQVHNCGTTMARFATRLTIKWGHAP